MLTQFSRTELLLGKEAMEKLKNSRVAVFGVGGVGGYVCGRQGACPPPRGRGRACPARGFSREWAVTGGCRGVGDAAPYVGGCPLTGSRANLRRGASTR